MRARKVLFAVLLCVLTISFGLAVGLAGATDKDTVIIAASESVTGNWDPTTHTSLGNLIIEDVIFDTLFKTPCHAENRMETIPAAALSYERIDDLTMEFKIRSDVKFHDGTDLDAEDVKATVEYYSDPRNPAFFWIQCKYTGEVIDKHTVRIKSERPNGGMLWGLSFLRIMSSEDIKNPEVLAQRPNGTGAYKYVKQDRDTTVLTVNENFWRTPPKVKNLHFRYIGDVSTRLLAILSGEVDAAERLNPEQVPVLEAKGDFDVQIVPGVEPVFVHFRCNKPPFKDNVALRRAMAYAVDRQAILKGIFGVGAYEMNAHIPATKIGYVDVPGIPEFNPEKARQLLAEAGYPEGKGLPELIFHAPVSRYPKDKEWATFVTAQFQSIGVPVKLVLGDPAAWAEKIYNPDQGHMVLCGWCTGSPEPDMILFAQWRGGMACITHVDDPDINRVLDKENTEVDLDKRVQVLSNETLPMLVQKMPSIPIAAHNFITAVNKRVKGFQQLPNGNFYVWELEK